MKLDSTGLDSKSSDSGSDYLTVPADLIRRVDLIISPPDQYPFALVSWTGSKVSFVGIIISEVYNVTYSTSFLTVHVVKS